jgi:hypothetical protein
VTSKEARSRWYHNGGKHSQMLSNRRMLLRNRLAWAYIKENLPDIAVEIKRETNKQMEENNEIQP